FPRFLVPIATILSNGINFAMETILIVLFYFVFPSAYHFNWTLVFLPVLVAIELLMLVGIGLALSVLNVRYRDVFYITTSALTIGFWATPILYTIEMAPPWLRSVLRLNPLSGVIDGARAVLMRGEIPDLTTLAFGAGVAVVLFVVVCAIFRRHNLRLADWV